MAPFEPFEPSPIIAVAVSGGADSLALAILGDAWTKERGGRAVGLIVDHRLRPESGAEAQRVADWLDASGLGSVILTRGGDAPRAGLQAAARAARYGLLRGWCRESGVLHLLIAHQRDDQAETFLMRHRRRAGLGLAAMAAIVEHRDVRLLRPLLGVSRGRIEATLRARGQAWLDDPSNRDRRFERVRARQAMPKLALRGWGPDRLAAEAARCAGQRREQETRLIALLGAAVRVHPMGFATIDRSRLLEARDDEGARALARVLTVVAGAPYPPSAETCARLMETLLRGQSRATLGGCLVLAREADWTVVREPRAAREVLPAAACPALWDGRFAVEWRGRSTTGLIIRRLGRDGRRQVRELVGARPGVSIETHLSLPALWSLDDVVCVPHLDIRRIQGTFTAWYRPRQMLLSPHLAGFVHGTEAVDALR